MLPKVCLLILVVLACVGARPRVRRQGFVWGIEDDEVAPTTKRTTPRATPPTPAPDGPTTTTSSPAFARCVSNCPATPQYNPVCGTNNVSYNNEGALNCASRCGLNVQIAFIGNCSPAA